MAPNPFIIIFGAIFLMASMGCVMGVGVVVGLICGIFFALEGDAAQITAFYYNQPVQGHFKHFADDLDGFFVACFMAACYSGGMVALISLCGAVGRCIDSIEGWLKNAMPRANELQAEQNVAKERA
jgi:hypothetical protein